MSMWKAFGRGFDSRRLHLTVLFCLFASVVFAQQDRLLVFEGSKKTQINTKNIEGKPYFRVADLQAILHLQLNPVAGNQNLSVSAGDHNVILSANRTLVSLDAKLVSLSSPVYLVEGEWYVPLDFVTKVLKVMSTQPFLWLENSRSLILGEIQPNQLSVKYSAEVDYSRLVFQSTRPIEYYLVYQDGTLAITPQSQDFVVGFQESKFDDGVIATLAIQSQNERKSFRVQTGENYVSFKYFQLNDPPRLVVDFYKKTSAPAPTPVEPPPSQQPSVVPPSQLPSTVQEKKVIVIDPGHGGNETGAKGPDGTYEKDIVLAIARKLRGLLESSGDVRVILTRDGDQSVSLDDRTALANNNKAELFLSIHANSTFRGYATGAETYFLSVQGTDDESRNVAAVENNAIGLNQELPSTGNDLKLILWDMAQTEYLSESSSLAETIQQELNAELGIANRGIKQAPFRVLMGATMPAVLVEVGFINNPSEEKLMKDADYQSKLASAIFRSIESFQKDRLKQAQLH